MMSCAHPASQARDGDATTPFDPAIRRLTPLPS